MRQHYHVLQGLAGLYTPNDNVVCRTRREAESCASFSARQARDDGYTVRGSAADSYYSVGESECIEITCCTEADCLSDLEV